MVLIGVPMGQALRFCGCYPMRSKRGVSLYHCFNRLGIVCIHTKGVNRLPICIFGYNASVWRIAPCHKLLIYATVLILLHQILA